MEQDFNLTHWKNKKCPKYDCRKDTCKCGLQKVVLPASLGDDSATSSIAPKNGAYCNSIVVYENNGHVYIYSKEGVPTLVETEGSAVEETIKRIEEELAQEVLDREHGDDVLQQEIDDLKNSPDVVDIVATYAALQAYDTSKLGDNDIIRVLVDEDHDGASTYYRWDKQTETWTYVGSIQTAANTIFYADLSETGNTRHIYKNSDMTGTVSVQELLDANEDGQVILRMSSAQTPENFNDAYLQNTYVGVSDYQFLFLDNRNYYEYDATTTADTSYYYSKSTIQLEMSAGTNITITGNTISATDTTYSDFVGTDGVDPGTAGLVPAPATTDAGKFLKSDGTWDTAGGGSSVTVVQTTGTSQTDVMSQNAVSSMVFADPGDDKKIKIGSGATVSAQNYNMAIGYNASANGSGAIAIGYSTSSRIYGIAIGGSAKAGNTSSHGSAVAIGYDAQALGQGAIAIGRGSTASGTGVMNIGASDTSYGYSSSNYRLLSGVYDGQQAHDAVTVGQVNATIDAINAALSTNIPHIGA